MKVENTLPFVEGTAPDQTAHYIVTSNGVPRAVRGSELLSAMALGAKAATQDEHAQIVETVLRNRQEREHPILSPVAAFAVPAIEQGLPFVGGGVIKAGEAAVEALGGPTAEAQAKGIERAGEAHPWLKTGGELTGFVGGMALTGAALGAAKTAMGVAHGAEAIEGAQTLFRAAIHEGINTGIQQSGAGFNEELVGNPQANAESLLGAALTKGAEGAALGIGSELLVGGVLKPGIRKLSQGYSAGVDLWNTRMLSAQAREAGLVVGANERAGMQILSSVLGGKRAARWLGDVIERGEFGPIADKLIQHRETLLAARNLSMVNKIGALREIIETEAKETVEYAKRVGKMPNVIDATNRAILGEAGLNPRAVEQIAHGPGGIRKVVQIAERLKTEGIHEPGLTPPQIYGRVKKAAAEAGKDIGRILDDLDTAFSTKPGTLGPNLREYVMRGRSELIEKLGQEPIGGFDGDTKNLISFFDGIERKLNNPENLYGTFRDAKELRESLGERIKWHAPEHDARKQAYGMLNEEIRKAIGRESPEALKAWEAANSRFSDLAEVRSLGARSRAIGRQTGDRLLSDEALRKATGEPTMKDLARSLPVDDLDPVSQELRQKVGAVMSMERLGRFATKRGARTLAQQGLEPFGATLKKLGPRMRNIGTAGVGIGLGLKMLDPEHFDELQGWAKAHPAQAIGLGLASMAAGAVAPTILAKQFANFVALGQREAVGAISTAGRASWDATEATLQKAFGEMISSQKLAGTAVHHVLAEESEHPEHIGTVYRAVLKSAANPNRAAEATALALAPLTAFAPNHSRALQAQISVDTAHLAQIAGSEPKRRPGYYDDPGIPPPAVARKMKAAREVMYNTRSVADNFAVKGSLIPSANLDTLRATRPETAKKMAATLMSSVASEKARGRAPDYTSQLRVGKIAGVSLNGHATPAFQAAMQAMWDERAVPPPPRQALPRGSVKTGSARRNRARSEALLGDRGE